MKSIIKVSCCLLFLVSSLSMDAQVSLERTKVTKDISMEIPESFVSMSQTELYNKYVSSRVPIAMYTSTDQLVDLGVNVNSSMWAATDYEILQDFYKANILNLFDEVEFLKEEIKEIGGKTFVVYEFVSKVSDEERTVGTSRSTTKYTYIIYTIHKNQVLLFNFSCPLRLRNQWEDTAEEIMESVRIR